MVKFAGAAAPPPPPFPSSSPSPAPLTATQRAAASLGQITSKFRQQQSQTIESMQNTLKLLQENSQAYQHLSNELVETFQQIEALSSHLFNLCNFTKK